MYRIQMDHWHMFRYYYVAPTTTTSSPLNWQCANKFIYFRQRQKGLSFVGSNYRISVFEHCYLQGRFSVTAEQFGTSPWRDISWISSSWWCIYYYPLVMRITISCGHQSISIVTVEASEVLCYGWIHQEFN